MAKVKKSTPGPLAKYRGLFGIPNFYIHIFEESVHLSNKRSRIGGWMVTIRRRGCEADLMRFHCETKAAAENHALRIAATWVGGPYRIHLP